MTGERKFVPQVEALEDRACPAAIAFQDGEKLKVISDDQPDTVAIVQTGGLVTTNVNGFVQTFFGVEKLDVQLNDGNDAVFFYNNGFGPGPAAPNAFVGSALTQHQAFLNVLFQSGNPALIGAITRFGEDVETEIDGGDGLNAVFVTYNANMNFNTVDFHFRDIQLLTFATPVVGNTVDQNVFGAFANLGIWTTPSTVPTLNGFLFNPDDFDNND